VLHFTYHCPASLLLLVCPTSRISSVLTSFLSFILPNLHLDNILAKRTIAKRRRALESSSTSLTDAYDDTLQRIRSQGPDNQGLEIIAWVFYAKMPLSLLELRHAIAIDLDSDSANDEFDKDNILDNSCISDCLGLVKVDVETGNVQFMHLSLLDYLNTSTNKGVMELVMPMQAVLAEKCVTYMLYRQIRAPPAMVTTFMWDILLPTYALRQATMMTAIQKLLADVDAELQVFGPYAARFWGDHLKSCGRTDPNSSLTRKVRRLSQLTEAEISRVSGLWHCIFMLDNHIFPWDDLSRSITKPWHSALLERSQIRLRPARHSTVPAYLRMNFFFGLRWLWDEAPDTATGNEALNLSDPFTYLEADFDILIGDIPLASQWEPNGAKSTGPLLKCPLNLLGYAVLGDHADMVELAVKMIPQQNQLELDRNEYLASCNDWLTFALRYRPTCARRILASLDHQGDLAITWQFLEPCAERFEQRFISAEPESPNEELLLDVVNHPSFRGIEASWLLCYAAARGFPRLASRLLQLEETDVNSDAFGATGMGTSPFLIALNVCSHCTRYGKKCSHEDVALTLFNDQRTFELLESEPAGTEDGGTTEDRKYDLLLQVTHLGWQRLVVFLLQRYDEIDINRVGRPLVKFATISDTVLQSAIQGRCQRLLLQNARHVFLKTYFYLALNQEYDLYKKSLANASFLSDGVELVRSILAHPRIDPNVRGLMGKTALHLATENLDVPVVELLLGHPLTDSDVEDDSHQTPYASLISRSERRENTGQSESKRDTICRLLLTHKEARQQRQQIEGQKPST
jgi:hypothetical protein